MKKTKNKRAYKPRRHKWTEIEKEFLSSDQTLGEVAKKHNVPYGMMTKRSMKHKWIAKRKEIIRKGQAKGEKKLVETYAQKYFKMCERHVNLAKILQSKGLTFLDQNDIDSAATAVNSIFKGAKLEKDVMDGNQNKSTTPINIFNSQNTITNLRGLTDAELQVIASGDKLIESRTSGGAGNIDEDSSEE